MRLVGQVSQAFLGLPLFCLVASFDAGRAWRGTMSRDAILARVGFVQNFQPQDFVATDHHVKVGFLGAVLGSSLVQWCFSVGGLVSRRARVGEGVRGVSVDHGQSTLAYGRVGVYMTCRQARLPCGTWRLFYPFPPSIRPFFLHLDVARRKSLDMDCPSATSYIFIGPAALRFPGIEPDGFTNARSGTCLSIVANHAFCFVRIG